MRTEKSGRSALQITMSWRVHAGTSVPAASRAARRRGPGAPETRAEEAASRWPPPPATGMDAVSALRERRDDLSPRSTDRARGACARALRAVVCGSSAGHGGPLPGTVLCRRGDYADTGDEANAGFCWRARDRAARCGM